MNIVRWLLAGGLIGWLASVLMKTNDQQGLVLNVVVGIVGALIGRFLIAPRIGSGTINQQDFSVSSLVVTFAGAVILLAVVRLVRRGVMR